MDVERGCMECVECGRDNHICYATTRPQEREHARDDAIVRVTLHTDTSRAHEKLAALSVSQFLPSRNIFLGHTNVRKDVDTVRIHVPECSTSESPAAATSTLR